MAWARHVPLVGRREVNTEFWCGYLRERAHLKDLRVDGEVILSMILKKYFGKIGLDFFWFRFAKNFKIFFKTNEV